MHTYSLGTEETDPHWRIPDAHGPASLVYQSAPCSIGDSVSKNKMGGKKRWIMIEEDNRCQPLARGHIHELMNISMHMGERMCACVHIHRQNDLELTDYVIWKRNHCDTLNSIPVRWFYYNAFPKQGNRLKDTKKLPKHHWASYGRTWRPGTQALWLQRLEHL